MEKAFVIGFDAPIVKSIKNVKEGRMPNVYKLIKREVWAENCLVPHPTITPPNWTTIVTGSWPGAHWIRPIRDFLPRTISQSISGIQQERLD